ncbi:hypothetical protein F3J16_01115 [Burkholderia sp. Ap-962]|uniref:Imm74 family immunity protein n=1 Tax=Burkholderia sp. Ap-962 TaxID=2608333 RepID=UPI00142484A3|nr:Imm74 family immunity protein [Burkholderia sp. Ap-962]NIF68800.1 hypothetical protein [Burkholderia sp. Ap-962]
MTFTVTRVSRGEILLNDDAWNVRVSGEGLLPSKPGEPSFVVYLDSMNDIDMQGKSAPASDAVRHEIIESIRLYFSTRGMQVVFE